MAIFDNINSKIQEKIKQLADNISSHLANKSNPHGVTAAQVGLGNVNNTSDANKPVSTAQAASIADAKSAGTSAQTSINNHTANKNNPHGVTASQVGALPLDGSVSMTGNSLYICNSGARIDADKANLSITAYDSADNSSYRRLNIAYKSTESTLANSLKFTSKENGTTNEYKIYGEHNKPKLNWERIWKNSSGTSTFAGQTISLTLSDYSAVVIMFRNSTSNAATTFSPMVRVSTGNYGAFGDFPQTNSHNHLVRQFTVKASEGIVFYSAYNNGTADNNLVIPMEVWAIY